LRLLGERNAPCREPDQSSSHVRISIPQVTRTCCLFTWKFKSWFVGFLQEVGEEEEEAYI